MRDIVAKMSFSLQATTSMIGPHYSSRIQGLRRADDWRSCVLHERAYNAANFKGIYLSKNMRAKSCRVFRRSCLNMILRTLPLVDIGCK